MPPSLLDVMVGKRVEAIEPIHGYFQIVFNGDSRFTILNRFAGDITSITGTTVVQVVGTDEAVELRFSNGHAITVSLRPEDYRGPESFTFFDDEVGIEVVEQ